VILIFGMMLSATAVAQNKYEVDGPECGGSVAAVSVMKTAIWSDAAHRQSAYGELEFRRTQSDVAAKHCSTTYRIFLSNDKSEFKELERLEWSTEEGEIASVAVVGLSADGTKLAADLMLTEGDWTEHRIFELDERSGQSTFRNIEQKIYKASERLTSQVENYYETIDGVSNDGLIQVTSIADSDARSSVPIAQWTFNPWTGAVERKRRKR
jgi:hypothetical protein